MATATNGIGKMVSRIESRFTICTEAHDPKWLTARNKTDLFRFVCVPRKRAVASLCKKDTNRNQIQISSGHNKTKQNKAKTRQDKTKQRQDTTTSNNNNKKMTIDLFPDIVHENDLSPDGFGPAIDERCEQIHDGVKGWGANAKAVTEALGDTTATERYQIAMRYREIYEKDLREVMKSEFSGDYGTAVQLLALPPHEAECRMIKLGTDGIGAKVVMVYSILCGRTNREIEILKKTYFKMYTKDLSAMLASELHGDMERLIFNCLQAGEDEFDPQFHSREKITEDGDAIHKMGQARWGTDEKGIFKILCASPPEHLTNVNTYYSEKYGYSLEKAMEKELGGNVEKACLFLLGMKLKPYETISALIKSACAGFGTDELLLTCCCIRFQHVMKPVMSAHIELYSKTVHDRIRHETGGKYRDLLLAVVNKAWPEF